MAYIIQEKTLNSIGTAIRNKTGKADLLSPAEMVVEINSLRNNAVEPITITTNGTYTPTAGLDGFSSVVVDVPYYMEDAHPVPNMYFEIFYEDKSVSPYIYRNWSETGTETGDAIRDWVYDHFYTIIREIANPITRCSRFCYNNTYITELRIKIHYGAVDMESMFEGCTNFGEYQPIYFDGQGNVSEHAINIPANAKNMFKNCHNFRLFNDYELYEEVQPPYGIIDASEFELFSGGINIEGMFDGCYSLRRIPYFGILAKHHNNGANYIFGSYDNTFKYCHVLDTIRELPVSSTEADVSTSLFYNTFFECFRVKDFTFLMNGDVPYTANWSGQTIDLSKYVGYGYAKEYDGKNAITGFNSLITEGFLMSDEASYNANKDATLGYTYNVGYSRYNKTSAINTINSLPDTSAFVAEKGRTNTIKFTGIAGELTEGGAINTLSDETIAAAAAKGWTVSYV